jgi:hypothetical protein
LPKESLALVLRAQPDKTAAFTLIALSLDRLVKLYQIPGWSKENSEFLAEWIFDKYECDPLDLILNTLKSPPDIDVTAWRLTPDTVSKWMTIALEKKSRQLEQENALMKPEVKEELPGINYESFKSRLVDGCLPDNKEIPWCKKPEYLEYKQKYLEQRKRVNESKQ